MVSLLLILALGALPGEAHARAEGPRAPCVAAHSRSQAVGHQPECPGARGGGLVPGGPLHGDILGSSWALSVLCPLSRTLVTGAASAGDGKQCRAAAEAPSMVRTALALLRAECSLAPPR